AARFCYGLYERRDGSPLWSGPVDRLLDGAPEPANQARVPAFTTRLCRALAALGCFAREVIHAEGDAGRVLLRFDGQGAVFDAQQDPRLGRCSIHALRVEGAGLVDELAAEGSYLLLVHAGAGGSAQPTHNELWVELPAFPGPTELSRALACLAEVCRALELSSLGVRGFAPGVDASVAWTSITPDPAVLEINQAPYADLASFQRASLELFQLAEEIGLSPYRLQYNGAVFDSGGGGQLTFGGPTPAASPFFTCPALLPRLIRYVVRHPSLSYWFATQYVGGSSQSPRPDEGARESFLELAVALEQLALHEAPTPELLWGTLRHFLVDASGNPHRSALNIEKLDNPFLPGRGRLGLVELRALAMAKSPHIATARAMLLRGVLAMLMRRDECPELTHWLDTLHDRFALPFYLEQDLREVFADLTRAGLGLGTEAERLLLARDEGVLADAVLEDCHVRVDQALEFWPLVGDVAAQEAVSSRLVDASTSRIQVLVEGQGADTASLNSVQITANGHRLRLRNEPGPRGPARVLGLRYRAFVPWTGLHPSLPAEEPIVLTIAHPSGRTLRLTLHAWRPD
ncbi:MAG TPA: transglutaminase family protein, partial [Polyangiales bacterium]